LEKIGGYGPGLDTGMKERGGFLPKKISPNRQVLEMGVRCKVSKGKEKKEKSLHTIRSRSGGNTENHPWRNQKALSPRKEEGRRKREEWVIFVVSG